MALAGCSADTSVGTPEATLATEQSGPLTDLLGYGAVPDSAQAIVSERTWQENLTAQCMADLGFDYLPAIPDLDSVVFSDGPVGGTREYVEAYGYGLWSRPLDEGGFELSVDDPNGARVDAMSEAERAAYELALYGQRAQPGADSVSSVDHGCEAASTVPVDDDTRYIVSVREDATQYLTDMHDDPAFSEVNAEWASCMADAGFVEESPLGAREGANAEYGAARIDGEMPSPNPARIEEEIRLATADLDCQEATGWPATYAAIAHRLEQEYVDDHQADLDALVEALPASGS